MRERVEPEPEDAIRRIRLEAGISDGGLSPNADMAVNVAL
jgi:hypothetical protein